MVSSYHVVVYPWFCFHFASPLPEGISLIFFPTISKVCSQQLQDHNAWVNLITDITRYTAHLSLAHLSPVAIKDNIEKPLKWTIFWIRQKTYTDKIGENLNCRQTTPFWFGLVSVGIVRVKIKFVNKLVFLNFLRSTFSKIVCAPLWPIEVLKTDYSNKLRVGLGR